MTEPQTFTRSVQDGESIAAFAQWAAAALLCEQAAGPGQPAKLVAVASPEPPVDAATDSQLLWLESLKQHPDEPLVFEATPVDDLQHVRDLSGGILGAYHARRGHVELAGCTLEPRPFLRLTFRDGPSERLQHAWFGGDGQTIGADLTQRLGLAALRPTAARLRGSDRVMVERWIMAALASHPHPSSSVLPPDAGIAVRTAGNGRQQREGVEHGGPNAPPGLVAATVAWCRWASGKVAISFPGGQRVEVPFDGWAADYRSGRLLPPPYRCVESGLASRDLCLLDDGTVTVAEALARCEQSGAEVLAARLGTCQVTGRRALRDLLVRCEVTGKQALAEAVARCQWCERHVLPGELHNGRCRDCRNAPPIVGDDSLWRQVLAQHPLLARYKRWRGWRGDEVAVMTGTRWSGDVVVICDPRTGLVRRQGRHLRWRGGWQWQPPTLAGEAAEPAR